MDHHTTICEAGEGGAQAVCSCGWRSPVYGTDKTSGTMDPLQRAAEAGDLHEWEMSLRHAEPTYPAPGRAERRTRRAPEPVQVLQLAFACFASGQD